MFYGCKFISSKTGLNRKFNTKLFGRKFVMVAKSFPRKMVLPKNFHQTFLVHNFYGGKIISSEHFRVYKHIISEACLLLKISVLIQAVVGLISSWRWLTRKGNYILKSNLPIDVQNMTLKSIDFLERTWNFTPRKKRISEKHSNGTLEWHPLPEVRTF